MSNIKLLDCTLRDGGYLNDWQFGESNILNISERLVSAGIDIIELGFIDERRDYDKNRTIFPDTKAMSLTYKNLNPSNSILVGMIDFGTCGIEYIEPCEDTCLDGIRVIFKKERMTEALQFCQEIKNLGYKTFVQAVSITSYNDEEFTQLLDMVNNLEPYAFSLVDTYGLLHKGQLLHYFRFACTYLKNTIGIGYHAHNNFQLAYANCIELLQNPPKDRMLIVDGTLYGMGKSAGNSPIELLAMYMNEYLDASYANHHLLEAIEVTILEIRRQVSWGYDFKFFMAASHDCHPNYVNYLMDLKKLSVKSISELLDSIVPEKKLLYDAEYIRQLYLNYQKNDLDDSKAIRALTDAWRDKELLLIGPGNMIYQEQKKVEEYISDKHPLVVSINFIPQEYKVDYVFMSNAKRYVQLASSLAQKRNDIILIATSNVTKSKGEFDYTLNYASLLKEDALMPDNPLIMLLKLLSQVKVKAIGLAGFDGYNEASLPNYINPNMEYEMSAQQAERINRDTITGIKMSNVKAPLKFVTTSKYDVKE